jgi:prepilin-type N-terminal cleavage/methylation domain-containing protein
MSRSANHTQRTFTLIEVLVAMAILSVLGTALIMILRGGLSTWQRAEARRESYDQAQAIFQQLREDLANITPPHDTPIRSGAVESRLLCDLRHPENTTNGPTVGRGVRQRLVLVRSLKAESEHPITGHAGNAIGADTVIDLRDDLAEARASRLRATGGQMEVAWVLTDTNDLYRGVRSPIGPPATLFDDGNYELAALPSDLTQGQAAATPPKDPKGEPAKTLGPRPALLRPFAQRVIHLEFRFWSQYSRGWKTTHRTTVDTSRAESGPLLVWDSTRSLKLKDGRARKKKEFTTYVRAGSFDDSRDDVIPSKVRVLLVLAQEPIAGSSTFLLAEVGETDTEIRVQEPHRLSWTEDDGGYLYIGGEWIHYDSVSGDTVNVSPGGRGNRWTVPKAHDTSELVHVGKSFVAIVDVPGFREDWGDTARRARARR